MIWAWYDTLPRYFPRWSLWLAWPICFISTPTCSYFHPWLEQSEACLILMPRLPLLGETPPPRTCAEEELFWDSIPALRRLSFGRTDWLLLQYPLPTEPSSVVDRVLLRETGGGLLQLFPISAGLFRVLLLRFWFPPWSVKDWKKMPTDELQKSGCLENNWISGLQVVNQVNSPYIY